MCSAGWILFIRAAAGMDIWAVCETASADRVVLRPHIGVVRAIAVRARAASAQRWMSQFGALGISEISAEHHEVRLAVERDVRSFLIWHNGTGYAMALREGGDPFSPIASDSSAPSIGSVCAVSPRKAGRVRPRLPGTRSEAHR